MKIKNIIDNYVYKSKIEGISLTDKLIINTINAHSYCVSRKDKYYENALIDSGVLVPDGVSIVWAAKVLNQVKLTKIAGSDIHKILIEKANNQGEKIFYLGSSDETLKKIEKKIHNNYPNIKVKSYSPPYKEVFDDIDTERIIDEINSYKPSILFVGMTAPKQEKWVYENSKKIEVNVIASIGAVFDFYAGTVKRAPKWMIDNNVEWLYRFLLEPRRMWKRYLINNVRFLFYVFKEKMLLT